MSPLTTRALLALAVAGATACAEAPNDLASVDHGPPDAPHAEAQVDDSDLTETLDGVDLGEILAEIMRSSSDPPEPVMQYCTIVGAPPSAPPPPLPPPDPPEGTQQN